jgi:hypothetical protein
MLDVRTSSNGILGAREASDETPRNRYTPHWARLPHDDTHYSDWQIDVRFVHGNSSDDDYNINSSSNTSSSDDDNHGDEEVVSYRVHRYIMGLQSQYFNIVFRHDHAFSESHERRSAIEFPAHTGITRQHFEDFLDFLYDTRTNKKLELDSDKGLAMLYLADYFGLEKIREQALEFLRSQLTSRTCSEAWLAKLYLLAEFLSIEELQDAIARIRSSFSMLYFPSYEWWSRLQRPELQREFLCRMCTERQKANDTTNPWSSIIAGAISAAPDSVDRDLFVKLTNKETMPVIETLHTSVILLQHECRLRLDDWESNELTCLQQRCTSVIHRELYGGDERIKLWRFVFATPEDVRTVLRGLKPSILRTIDQRHFAAVEGSHR